MIELNDYRLFAAIADHGGLTSAAQAMGLSKAFMSNRLVRLEHQLGISLAERTTRKFQLTAAGMQFLDGCRTILATAAQTEAGLALTTSRIGGPLRMSCPPGLTQDLLANIVPSFMQAYPKVDIHLLVVNRRVDIIDENIDVAFRVRVSMDNDQSFTQRTMARNPLLLVASPQLLASHAPIRRPEDLTDIPGIGMVHPPTAETWQLRRKQSVKQIKLEPRLRCEDFSIQLAAAIAGVGIALMPSHKCLDAVRNGQLKIVLPDWTPPEALIHMIFSFGKIRPTVRAFIDHAVEQCLPLREHFNPRFSSPAATE